MVDRPLLLEDLQPAVEGRVLTHREYTCLRRLESGLHVKGYEDVVIRLRSEGLLDQDTLTSRAKDLLES